MRVIFDGSILLEDTITRLRDQNTSSAEFRKLMKKLGRYLAYEAGKLIEGKSIDVTTPLTQAQGRILSNDIIVISVLRAAITMTDAVLDEFDNAQLGIVAASREEMLSEHGRSFKIKGDYYKVPDVRDKTVIIVDPMLASASTMIYLLEKLDKNHPKKIIILAAISAEFGIARIEKEYPSVEILSGVIDDVLNEHGYIVPGLGDAGDRMCNTQK